VIRSSRATSRDDDRELRIIAAQDLNIRADIQVAGSASLAASRDIRVDNATLTAAAAGQTLAISSGRHLLLGNVSPVAGDATPHAVVLAADRLLDLKADGEIRLAADAAGYVASAGGTLRLAAGALHVVGELKAGARWDATAGLARWSGAGALLDLQALRGLTIGGTGLDANRALVDRGAYLAASGTVQIATGPDASGVGMTLTRSSSITSNANFDPTWVPTAPSRIRVQATGLVNLEGTVRAVDQGADISLATDSLVMVDGLMSAQDTLSIEAGSHRSRLGLWVKPVVAGATPEAAGTGGVLDVAAGGRITLTAIDGIEVAGAVGLLSAGQAPVVLCGPHIRLAFRRFFEATFSDLTVLSYSEVPSKVDIQSAGTLVVPEG